MPQYSRDTAKVGVKHQSFGNQVYMPRYSWDTAKVGVKHQSFGNQVYMPRYSWNTAEILTPYAQTSILRTVISMWYFAYKAQSASIDTNNWQN
jgi:hypothetical protein